MAALVAGDVKVSIVINNYNYARFLGAAIESALAQSHANTEVIVVDDGSTDNSREIIAGYGERIRPIFKANGGQGSAFNAGVGASRGDLICMLDADDFFAPEKAEQVAIAFAARPEIGWVFHPVRRVFEDGRSSTVAPRIAQTRYIDHREPALRRGRLPGPPGPVTSGLVLTRRLLDQLLPISEAITITADNYLIFLAMALAPGIYLSEPLATQRLHGTNLYTFRKDMVRQARIHLLIAQSMRRRCPRLSLLSNHIFARSLAWYLTALRRDRACEQTIGEYLRHTRLLELPDLMLRAGYHAVRNSLAIPAR